MDLVDPIEYYQKSFLLLQIPRQEIPGHYPYFSILLRSLTPQKAIKDRTHKLVGKIKRTLRRKYRILLIPGSQNQSSMMDANRVSCPELLEAARGLSGLHPNRPMAWATWTKRPTPGPKGEVVPVGIN